LSASRLSARQFELLANQEKVGIFGLLKLAISGQRFALPSLFAAMPLNVSLG
jgi:hypothetical protein